LLHELRRRLPPAAEASAEAARAPAGGEVVPAVLREAAPAAAVAASSPSGDGPILPEEVLVGDSRLRFYGFVRLDAIFDDSRPSALQTPTFILSEGPGNRDENSFNFHPRLTRFGMSYAGPEVAGLGGASLGGKIEIDFQNGGRESRQIVRMRHGYLTLGWDDVTLLVGQTWDAFSPLYPTVNSDTLMWNAGNLGDRRPQVRVRVASERDGGTFSFTGGIGLTGAIDSQDLDGDGIRDGDDAVLPNVQLRFAWDSAKGARNPWSLGFSGHYGREEVQTPIAGRTDFDSFSLNLDVQATFNRRVFLKGELWTGENLSDFRGGIGQGINPRTGGEIESAGGWLELGFKASEVYSVYVGQTLDDPTDADVPPGGRIENRASYLVNRFRFGRPFMIGLDYLNWKTRFKGLPSGTDNRLNLYLIYNF
ncbi:MAG: hypothetical protein D6696_03625, partial [Acidobacteria bacterium]